MQQVAGGGAIRRNEATTYSIVGSQALPRRLEGSLQATAGSGGGVHASTGDLATALKNYNGPPSYSASLRDGL